MCITNYEIYIKHLNQSQNGVETEIRLGVCSVAVAQSGPGYYRDKVGEET